MIGAVGISHYRKFDSYVSCQSQIGFTCVTIESRVQSFETISTTLLLIVYTLCDVAVVAIAALGNVEAEGLDFVIGWRRASLVHWSIGSLVHWVAHPCSSLILFCCVE